MPSVGANFSLRGYFSVPIRCPQITCKCSWLKLQETLCPQSTAGVVGRPHRTYGAGLGRAAALIVLSVIAGYVLRLATEPSVEAPDTTGVVTSDEAAWVTTGDLAPTPWESRTIEAWGRQHGTSGLARSLLALSDAGSPEPDRPER